MAAFEKESAQMRSKECKDAQEYFDGAEPMKIDAVPCDVLVIGSGAAGLATAIKAAKGGLKVIVLEKSEFIGGTTAISAGWAWVPGNKQGLEQGDTREEAELYLRHLAPDTLNEASVKAFLDAVPEAIDFFENQTDIEFIYPEKAPDYQMDLPGAKVSGRAIMPKGVNARILGKKRLSIQPYLSSYTVFGYMPEVGPDINEFFHVNQSFHSFMYVSRKLLRTWLDAALFRRAVLRTNGNALITRMVKTATDLGITIWTSTTATELTSTAGVVSGALVSGPHANRVSARLGVVVAAGGFSGSEDLRKQYFPHEASDHFTPTVGHHGDSVALVEPLGGIVDSAVSSVASWAPVTVFKDRRGGQRLFPHLRAFGLPGLIAVDRAGQRFGNESWSYHDFGGAMISHNADCNETFGYIVADEKAMHKYGIGYAKPWPMPRRYFFNIGYLTKAQSLHELASKIGIDSAGLETAVQEFNRGAAVGEDLKFGRGSNWYHHFKGDMAHRPNPNLEPLDKAPYYAAKIQMGDLGTFAGVAVNERSQVLTQDGGPVAHLYAVGSAAVSVFGGGYPGYGANIGPALVFGYLVGQELVRVNADDPQAD
jgi:hypothetical protein